MKRILFAFAFLFAVIAAPTGVAMAATTTSAQTSTISQSTIQPNTYPEEPLEG